MHFLAVVTRGFSRRSPGPCPLHPLSGCSGGCSSPSQTLWEHREGERGQVWVLSWSKVSQPRLPSPPLHTHHVPVSLHVPKLPFPLFLSLGKNSKQLNTFPSLLSLALAGQKHIQEQPWGFQAHPSKESSLRTLPAAAPTWADPRLHFPASHTQTQRLPWSVCSHWETCA